MNLNLLKDVRSAYANLNPGEVRRLSQRYLSVGLAAATDGGYYAMESFLSPSSSGCTRLHRVSEMAVPSGLDLVLCDQGLVCPREGFIYYPRDLQTTVDSVLDARPELEIPLARDFRSFRSSVIDRIIQRTSRENAFFALVTALPNVVPNVLELPWAIGEFATDTAFLTINQIRMNFLIAACHGKPVGYAEQKLEIAALVAGAFGWRAIARELAGKIPLGGGLIPKAAIAFAGSYVVGLGLDRVHRTGKHLPPGERRSLYDAALSKGKSVVNDLVAGVKKSNAA